jgi:hypothetical protein
MNDALAAKFSDRYESFYPSLAEAAKDGAITRGWIPDDFLPRSSHSIHEVHDLSNSTEMCAFEFVPTDSQNILANLKPLDVLPQSVGRVPSAGVVVAGSSCRQSGYSENSQGGFRSVLRGETRDIR